MEDAAPVRKHFGAADDLVLLRAVLAIKPWEASFGTSNGVMKSFAHVADLCRETPQFVPDKQGPALRTRFEKLVRQYRDGERAPRRASGTVEQYEERDRLLQDIISRMDEWEQEKEKAVEQATKRDEIVAQETSVSLPFGSPSSQNVAVSLSGTLSVDLEIVAFGEPVVLLSSFGRSLESAMGAKGAVCFRKGSYAGVELVRAPDDGVAIRALHSGLHLSVREGGDCFFDAQKIGDTEKFALKATTSGELYFVSYTGAGDRWLLSDRQGSVRCSASSLSGFEYIWHVAIPSSTVSDLVPQSRPAATCLTAGAHQGRADIERRQYIMRLVELGKSVDEVDEILKRMYASAEEAKGTCKKGQQDEEETEEIDEDEVVKPARKKRAIRQ